MLLPLPDEYINSAIAMQMEGFKQGNKEVGQDFVCAGRVNYRLGKKNDTIPIVV
jgi:hypothetical protein